MTGNEFRDIRVAGSAVMTTKRITAHHVREVVSFGVYDAKGREIGCIVIRDHVTFAEQDAGKTWGYTTPAGDYVEVQVQAARDGQPYGASQSRKLWALAQADGAEPYIAKRIADSRKAAAKKAALVCKDA